MALGGDAATADDTNADKNVDAKSPPKDEGTAADPAQESNKAKDAPSNANDGGAAAADQADDDDDDEEMDEEQLEEYQEMLGQLGGFPDKVMINSLSMVAEDFASSSKAASALYGCIRDLLRSKDVSSDRKLPLVYVVDSILKNVKGKFIPLIEADAKEWMAVVHGQLGEEQRAKLRKVWNTWREFGIFGEDSLKEMGRVFSDADAEAAAKKMVADAKAKAAGISRAPDGTLKVSSDLRKQMQILLDEAQSDGVDELDKVSLERLADINPTLLVEIKKAAEDILRTGSGSGATDMGSGQSSSAQQVSSQSAFMDPRPPQVITRAADWQKLDLNHLEKTHDVISSLQHQVRAGTTMGDAPVDDPAAMLDLLVAASATANNLTKMLETLKDQEARPVSTIPNYGGYSSSPRSALAIDKVDRSLFTNEGLKKKNDHVIARLYNGGLPFVSSSDGRRFATQLALSKHLDELFRRGQVEKTMERTEERGWYVAAGSWTGLSKEAAPEEGSDTAAAGAAGEAEEVSPEDSTVPADESRDRCVICGINFTMFFDQDEGEWKYKNCREINVLNDDAAAEESEDLLVHVTCLRGLGSPEFLTADQVIQLH